MSYGEPFSQRRAILLASDQHPCLTAIKQHRVDQGLENDEFPDCSCLRSQEKHLFAVKSFLVIFSLMSLFGIQDTGFLSPSLFVSLSEDRFKDLKLNDPKF
jgi:hypothetical protein